MINGRFNKEKYLQEASVPFIPDNNPIRTARIIQSWFAEHPPLEVLPWPAHSSNLNPIENIWADIVREFDVRGGCF